MLLDSKNVHTDHKTLLKNANEILWDIWALVAAFILYAGIPKYNCFFMPNIPHKQTGAINTNAPMGHQLLLHKWDCNPLKGSPDSANYKDAPEWLEQQENDERITFNLYYIDWINMVLVLEWL